MRKWKCVSKENTQINDERWTVNKIYVTNDNGGKLISDNNDSGYIPPWLFSSVVFKEIKSTQKSIHITFSDNSTHAVLKDGKDVIKQSTVGLYHKDEYKFEVGVMEVVKKLLDIKDEKVDECEDCKPKFVKANLGDKIRIIKNNMEHSPSIKIGDEFIVGYVGDDCVYNCKYCGNGNVLLDSDEEYEIIEESTNQLSDYTVDELLSEIKLRMEK